MGVGGTPINDGDDCCLALGCKLQILVSLRVFGTESHHVSLSTVYKEIYKKYPDIDHTEISLKGQFRLEPHPHPVTFIWEVPLQPPAYSSADLGVAIKFYCLAFHVKF